MQVHSLKAAKMDKDSGKALNQKFIEREFYTANWKIRGASLDKMTWVLFNNKIDKIIKYLKYEYLEYVHYKFISSKFFLWIAQQKQNKFQCN